MFVDIDIDIKLLNKAIHPRCLGMDDDHKIRNLDRIWKIVLIPMYVEWKDLVTRGDTKRA